MFRESTAALLLVSSIMLRNLSCGRMLKACSIATSPLENGFCYDLMLNVVEKIFSFGLLRADIAT